MSEYEFLRNEMITRYNHTQVYTTVLYLTTITILTFVLGTTNQNYDRYFMCFSPIFIIVPFYCKCEAHRKFAALIGAYLYVFHEGEDFNWERRHHEFDKRNNKRDWKNLLIYYTPVLLCVSAAIYDCIVSKDQDVILKVLNAILIALLICGFLYHNQTHYTEIREHFILEWIAIKREENRDKKKPKEVPI